MEILGEHPELSYPRDRKQRFTDVLSENQSVIGIKYGPLSSDLLDILFSGSIVRVNVCMCEGRIGGQGRRLYMSMQGV